MADLLSPGTAGFGQYRVDPATGEVRYDPQGSGGGWADGVTPTSLSALVQDANGALGVGHVNVDVTKSSAAIEVISVIDQGGVGGNVWIPSQPTLAGDIALAVWVQNTGLAMPTPSLYVKHLEFGFGAHRMALWTREFTSNGNAGGFHWSTNAQGVFVQKVLRGPSAIEYRQHATNAGFASNLPAPSLSGLGAGACLVHGYAIEALTSYASIPAPLNPALPADEAYHDEDQNYGGRRYVGVAVVPHDGSDPTAVETVTWDFAKAFGAFSAEIGPK